MNITKDISLPFSIKIEFDAQASDQLSCSSEKEDN